MFPVVLGIFQSRIVEAFKIVDSPGNTWSALPPPDGTAMLFKIVSMNHSPWMNGLILEIHDYFPMKFRMEVMLFS
ncbi:MAG: hypothetical protein V7K94_30715 [Nostoc sp.]|uniref:hypothetical protein n=1 Tax=Nostoc sp. TaxID=1180 RepID=UPI002FF86349